MQYVSQQSAENHQIPQVSVIVVNYNGRFYLPACFDALQNSVGSDVELIFVDNQSTDESVSFMQTHYPDVKVVLNSENNGYAGGNNLGVSMAQGEFIVILNPDTAVQTGWLSALIEPLQHDASLGMTTPRILLLAQPNICNTAGNMVHLSGITLCRGMGQPKQDFAETAVVSAVSGAAFGMRKSLFEALGGFDPQFFMYMEDTDLSLRVQLAGYKLLYVPESIVLHDYTLKFGPNKTYYQERNRYIMLLKNARWQTLLLLLPGLLLAEAITWGFTILKDRTNWRNKIRAYGYLITHWSQIMGMRAQSQTQRRRPDSVWLKRTTSTLDFEQAADGLVAKVAHWTIDPFFAVWRRLMLQVVA